MDEFDHVIEPSNITMAKSVDKQIVIQEKVCLEVCINVEFRHVGTPFNCELGGTGECGAKYLVLEPHFLSSRLVQQG